MIQMPDQDKNLETQRPEALIDGFPASAHADLLVSVFPDIDPNSPVLGESDEVEVAANMDAFIRDPSTIVASLEENGKLIGCSIAIPAEKMNPDREGAENTAYIYFTAIDPAKQGSKLVEPLMASLFEKVAERGYTYIERDSIIENGYADDVEKNYTGAIVDSYDHSKYPEAGPERFFRIELGKVAFKKLD